jgi:dienelactone hydrolase
MKKLACLPLLLAASGCPSVDVDDFGEETRPSPVVEFDPSNRIVPFPNNLLLDPTTGKVNLPAQCNEPPTAKALRENVLNQLDGFGLFETALTVTFTEAIDMASLADRVVVYKRATGTMPVDPAMAAPLPIVTQLSSTIRFDADCRSPAVIPQLVIVPRVPLEQKSTYVVALLDGIKTASGQSFQPSATWRLIRGAENPVTVQDGTIVSDRTPLDPAKPEDRARLLGIDLLWKAHAGGVKFLAADLPADKRKPREQILLAWEFRTQTATDPLDPTVAGSPASEVATTPLAMNTSLPTTINRANIPYNQCPAADSDTQCFLKIQIGRGNYAVGDATCQSLGCAAVADVVGSGLVAKQYQVDTLNPYTGTGTRPIPGSWNNPIDPTEVKTEAISVLSFVPAAAMPAGGYPVVVFQHALGQSRTTAFAIAGRLAAAGFATVAIDAVGHDSRAVRVSNNAAIGCADVDTPPMCSRPDCGPSPVDFPQCYAPFLSPNLGATRDGIRQTVIDNLRLIAALKACSTTACGSLKVDPAKVLYLGQSLGGIVGTMTAAVSPDIKATVLNVPGVGWVDILENTGTLRLQCLLVDGLIDAGILMGEKSNLQATPPTGLCTMPDQWLNQPGYRQFSVIGRWILDPADPANFTRKLAPRRFLIQQVVGDTVIPAIATTNQGMLVGLMPAMADPAAAVPPPPSGAITTNPMSNKWVRYMNLSPDGGTGFPGNTFHHGSLLSPTPTPMPPPPPPDGALGTLRMQIDALTFLSLNQ